MEVNEILCEKTGKIIKSDKIFKVRPNEDDCIEEIVSYCSLCPNSESGKIVSNVCKNCYGAIAQSRKKFRINGKGRYTVQVENYRNIFEVDEFGEYIKDMNADDFMNFIEKTANLGSLNWNHGQKTDDKLRAYDKPKSWKTDCVMCKQKCANNNSIPECEKAKNYLEEKFDTSIECMSEKQLLLEIPTEFICQNQAQTLYYV